MRKGSIDIHVSSLLDRRHAAPGGELHLHAAGEVPDREPDARSEDRGTTIAELGNRNRPLDIILYRKDGREFLLMANNSRGVMKIPTEPFATAAPITAPVNDSETAGVPYETVASTKGIEQLDKLDDARSIVIARGESVS